MFTEKAVRKRTPSLPKGESVPCLHTNHLLGVSVLCSRNLLGGLTSRGYCLVYLGDAKPHRFKGTLWPWFSERLIFERISIWLMSIAQISFRIFIFFSQ